TVLDEIGDPILHLLRNCVDHGIESPKEREAACKSTRGLVRLDATRDRDQVRITVSDDGHGIDVESVWKKACDLSLANAESRDTYSENDILLFTCVPGFSTADKATKVSGRGVGMDVVKGKIEHLGGTLRIQSRPGLGTEVVLTLPLTLAIIQALMLGARGQVFAMPLSSVDEVMDPDDVVVDTVDSAPVVVLREGTVAPVFPLDAVLGLDSDLYRSPTSGEHIVLIDSGGVKRALLAEELLGRREIVIKPLSRMFRRVRGLGGATVLGDGRVALILDPRTIFPSREEVV
ncbi:MAG: chemotaxis protein CheW, partial [Coriobacteriia bacterium]|nr:chemotaxis protein CheW [Coriobacteriia bacterium]